MLSRGAGDRRSGPGHHLAVRTRNGASGITSVAVGLVAGCAFVIHERRTSAPALDMRVFRSSQFNAAVTAGVVFNIVLGGSMVLLSFYLVTIRKESHEVFGFLLIPATAMAAVAAFSAGPVANRLGTRTVLISGLVVMFAGLMVLRTFDLDTSRPVVFATTALIVVGGALVTTPQATIMMSSAPDDLGGRSPPSRAPSTRADTRSGLPSSPWLESTSSSPTWCTTSPTPESPAMRRARRC
jgi:hypothetical protein